MRRSLSYDRVDVHRDGSDVATKCSRRIKENDVAGELLDLNEKWGDFFVSRNPLWSSAFFDAAKYGYETDVAGAAAVD